MPHFCRYFCITLTGTPCTCTVRAKYCISQDNHFSKIFILDQDFDRRRRAPMYYYMPGFNGKLNREVVSGEDEDDNEMKRSFVRLPAYMYSIHRRYPFAYQDDEEGTVLYEAVFKFFSN